MPVTSGAGSWSGGTHGVAHWHGPSWSGDTAGGFRASFEPFLFETVCEFGSLLLDILPFLVLCANTMSAAPWATHYELPPAAGLDGRSARRHESGRERESGGGGRVHGSFLGGEDENLPYSGSVGSGQDSDAGWKRPRTLAPPWAAGGGQEMILSSPAQGRKVSFVIEKPAFYNVEDAPSAVPTSRSDRSWEAGDNRRRPTTPAAPPVLRQPGALASRPRTPAGRGPLSAERQSLDLGEEVAGDMAGSYTPDLRPPTPSAVGEGAHEQYARPAPDMHSSHADERDTAPLRFVKAAEAALQGPQAPAQSIGDGVNRAVVSTVDAGGDAASVAEAGTWNLAPPPSGRGKDAYGVPTARGRPPTGGRGAAAGRGAGMGAESARDRAKGVLPFSLSVVSGCCVHFRRWKCVHIRMCVCVRACPSWYP